MNNKPQRFVYPIGSRTRFSENMLKQSLEPSGRLINSDYVLSDSVMAALLECRVGTRLHRLDSLSVADGIPLSRSTSYFSAERFPGIIEALPKSVLSPRRRDAKELLIVVAGRPA